MNLNRFENYELETIEALANLMRWFGQLKYRISNNDFGHNGSVKVDFASMQSRLELLERSGAVGLRRFGYYEFKNEVERFYKQIYPPLQSCSRDADCPEKAGITDKFQTHG